MGTYSNLVSRIVKLPILLDEANKITKFESKSTPPTLNLLTTDWDCLLENSFAFQNCHFRSDRKPITNAITNNYADYETSTNTLFNITLVAYCKFLRKYEDPNQSSSGRKTKDIKDQNSIMICNSEPLAKIAQVMTKDTGSSIPISNEYKFTFKNCSFTGCADCKESSEFFLSKGYTFNLSRQPCIAYTKVFDGKNIVNRFYSHLEQSFKNDMFIGILHLKLNKRYKYTDKSYDSVVYRVGGTVTHIVAFNEAKLDLIPSINLGDVNPFEFVKNCEDDDNSKTVTCDSPQTEEPLPNKNLPKTNIFIDDKDVDDIQNLKRKREENSFFTSIHKKPNTVEEYTFSLDDTYDLKTYMQK